VYLHFKSKAELIVAVVEHAKTRLGFDQAVARVKEAKSAEDALLAYFDMYAELTPKIARASRANRGAHTRPCPRRGVAEAGAVASGVDPLGHRAARHGRTPAAGWTVATAVDLLWAITAPGVAEDLTDRRRWSREKLGDSFFHLIASAMLEKGRRR
jgi:AcrR family transcriptional regulator